MTYFDSIVCESRRAIFVNKDKQYVIEIAKKYKNRLHVFHISKIAEANLFDNKLVVGNLVKHLRFGTGRVTKIEGIGADTKAEINFENGGLKKLLLRFAKLEVIG